MSDIKLTPEQEKVFSGSDYVTDGDGHYWDSDWVEVQEWMYDNFIDEIVLYPSKETPFKLLIDDFLWVLNAFNLDQTLLEIFDSVLERESEAYLENCENDYSAEELWPQAAEDKLFGAFRLFMVLNRLPMALGFKPWCQWILCRAIAKFNKAVEDSDCFAMLWPDESIKCVVKYEGQDDD